MDKRENFKLDAAFLIVIVTSLSYGLAYIFEFAFLDYYHLPRFFIDLNINSITRSLVVVIAVIGLILLLSETLTRLITGPGLSLFPIPKFATISLVTMLITGAIVSGLTSAALKKEYVILTHKNEKYVVLTTYKDNLVIAPVNLKTKMITPKYRVIEIKELVDGESLHFPKGLNVEDIEEIK